MGRSGSDNLTREGFKRFLERLDPEPESAGVRYQTLHRKLVKLFEWRGASSAESLADETIDRVIGKLDKVEIRDVVLYALGVAHNVLKESQRATAKNTRLEEAPVSVLLVNSNQIEQQTSEGPNLAKRLECLDQCVRALPAAEGKLVIEYYEKTKADNIRQRRKMAERLGIALGTLRVQAHRIRAKLAACLDQCLAEPD